MLAKPCLAITLIYPAAPEFAGSYHWCQLDEHPHGELHVCYCGIQWLTDDEDLVEPTAEMILWRTGTETQVHSVRGKLVG